jgi:hypothetical protein
MIKIGTYSDDHFDSSNSINLQILYRIGSLAFILNSEFCLSADELMIINFEFKSIILSLLA